MPLSHLTLTVSHLPTSTSFFLSCLQPLGYKFIGRHDDYIGFGQHSGEPADFWITEEKPGVPPGAAHVAFPAPSKDAVGTFFINALKAGGKLHGEPKTRDSESGYYSAAVMDFDGNSIEAVYRPGISSGASSASSVARSEVSRPALKLLENGSVVSKASSTISKGSPSTVKYAASRGAPTIVSRAPSSVHRSVVPSERGGPAASVTEKSVARNIPSSTSPTYVVHHTTTTTQKSDEGTTAKTIVGTLIGAAAGAAIAYAMSKGDSESSSTSPQHQQQQQRQLPPPQEHTGGGGGDFRQFLEAPFSQVTSHIHDTLRAIEAPPPMAPSTSPPGQGAGARSTYTSSEYNNNRPFIPRSMTSKNPRASTIYEATEYIPGGRSNYGGNGYTDQYGRRASDNASMYSSGSQREIPLRAIEYPPSLGGNPNGNGEHYPCDRSTLISSFPDKSRAMSVDMGMPVGMEYDHGHGHGKNRNGDGNGNGSVYSSASTIKASKVNGEEYTSSRHSTHSHSHRSSHSHSRHSTSRRSSHANGAGASNKSTISARDIPLPESLYGDNDDVGPEDSISQIGDSRRSSHSHAHSRHSTTKSHRSSKFDEPVRPSDSVSQVSRASQRTVTVKGKDVASSRVGGGHGSSFSRRGSQVV